MTAARRPDLAWYDPAWREKADSRSPWRAGCRLLQGWYRQEHLHEDAGPQSAARGALVVNMLPLGSDRNICADVRDEALGRLAFKSTKDEYWPRSIQGTRLWRNMLGSQPMAFNLFGHFTDYRSGGHSRAQALAPWVASIDTEATDIQVESVHLEWAPDPKNHLGSGGRGFVAIECKYAEKLDESFYPNRRRKKQRDGTTIAIPWGDGYRDYTDANGCWKTGWREELDAKGPQQFWLNTLLAQSLLLRPNGAREQFQRGSSVVMAHRHDREARSHCRKVALYLRKGHVPLVWSPYSALLDGLPEATWVQEFRRRYLDVAPVAHLLSDDDSRKGE